MVFCHLSHFQIEVKLTFLLKIVIVFSNNFNKQISYIGKYASHTLPYYTHLAANYPSESQSEEQEGSIVLGCTQTQNLPYFNNIPFEQFYHILLSQYHSHDDCFSFCSLLSRQFVLGWLTGCMCIQYNVV